MFEERFRLENNSTYGKTWVEIIDHSELGGQHASRVMAWIGKKEFRNYSSYTMLTHRGKFSLSPTEIKSGDPFGLFEKTTLVKNNQTLIVLPLMYKIQAFPLPPGYLPGGKSIRRRTAAITPHAAGIRDYYPGDSMNRIHWKKTAQRGLLITKEFEEDPQSDIWIILDSHALSHTKRIESTIHQNIDRFWNIKDKYSYQLPCDTYEYAVSIVATLAEYFIRIGQGVGFRDVGRQSLMLPPEKGYRQLEKILETLAYIEPDGEETLETGIISLGSQILPGSLVITIGTNNSSGLIRSAGFFKLRKIHPVFILLASSSFQDIPGINAGFESQLRQMGVVVKSIQYTDAISGILENKSN